MKDKENEMDMDRTVKELYGETPNLPYNDETLKGIVRQLLKQFDPMPYRSGLVDTPKRFLKFFHEFLTPKPFNYTLFDAEGFDDMVHVGSIEFYSLCEHHIVPFIGHAHVAYIPDKNIVGLSKIPRCVEKFSRRLQNQERITRQIAEELHLVTKCKGVAVQLSARHLCMCMRGVRNQGAVTTTSHFRGVFQTEASLREQFLKQIQSDHV